MKPPKVLDTLADVVLRYRPKPKSEAGKARKRKARKAAKAQS
jgi:hypothetical protein